MIVVDNTISQLQLLFFGPLFIYPFHYLFPANMVAFHYPLHSHLQGRTHHYNVITILIGTTFKENSSFPNNVGRTFV